MSEAAPAITPYWNCNIYQDKITNYGNIMFRGEKSHHPENTTMQNARDHTTSTLRNGKMQVTSQGFVVLARNEC